MNSKIFLFRKEGDAFRLYVGSTSASEGLAVYPSDAPVSVENYGGHDRNGEGWITKADLPLIKSVGEVRQFLENDGHNFIDLEMTVDGASSFSSYEDAECTYVFQSWVEVSKVIGLFSLPESKDLLSAELLKSPNVYIEYVGNGEIRRYETFDAYLSARRI